MEQSQLMRNVEAKPRACARTCILRSIVFFEYFISLSRRYTRASIRYADPAHRTGLFKMNPDEATNR